MMGMGLDGSSWLPQLNPLNFSKRQVFPHDIHVPAALPAPHFHRRCRFCFRYKQADAPRNSSNMRPIPTSFTCKR